MVRFEFRSGRFSTDKKVTVVKSCFYTVAEMHDVDLSFSTDRDSARLAIKAAQESPWGLSRPWGFSLYRSSRRLVPARHNYDIGATAGSLSSARPAGLFSCPAGLFSESEPSTLAGRVGTLWPRIHAVLFAYCRLITGFVLAFAGSWLADPQASSEYSPEG